PHSGRRRTPAIEHRYHRCHLSSFRETAAQAGQSGNRPPCHPRRARCADARCEDGSMLDSVAVLADIHGVLPVLDAVLALPAVRAADAIVVCGDHAAGPQPTEVLDRLTSL